MCWFGVRFSPGGHGALFGIINTFVHIIMYFYYMLSVMGPRYAKITKWKKYLTAIQMVKEESSLQPLNRIFSIPIFNHRLYKLGPICGSFYSFIPAVLY